ncbi:hypothetical protein Peur_060009 [Populus x canadensis]
MVPRRYIQTSSSLTAVFSFATLDLKLFHVLAQTNKLYIVESSCMLFIFANLNILFLFLLLMINI